MKRLNIKGSFLYNYVKFVPDHILRGVDGTNNYRPFLYKIKKHETY